MLETGARSYKVLVKKTDGETFINNEVAASNDGKQHLQASQLQPGMEYQVRIASIDKLNRQSKQWSSPAYFTTC